MSKTMRIYVLVGAWLTVFACSILFGGGLERIGRFLGWQVAALALAVVAGLVTRATSRRLRQRDVMIGYTPLGVSGMAFVAMIGLAVTGG